MSKNNKEWNKQNNRGFSLVELIVVIAIMAVLVGAMVPVFGGYVARSREAVCLTNRRNVQEAMEAAYALDESSMPADGEVSIPDDDQPRCPNGGEYTATLSNGHVSIQCSIHGEMPSE